MSIQPDLVGYHRSIGQQLANLQNQVRDLIGDHHWLSDGEHKEAILRKTIRDHISEEFHVGTGFAISDVGCSSKQVDILISEKKVPCLFQEGDFRIVSMNSVRSFVEVKTKQSSPLQLRKTLEKLSGNICLPRTCFGAVVDNLLPPAGLFVYNEPRFNVPDNLKEIVGNLFAEQSFINWICLGKNWFIRYWHARDRFQYGEQNCVVEVPQYRLYELNDLAMAYFISNVVWDIGELQRRGDPLRGRDMSGLWFPLEEGKESHFVCGVSKNGHAVNEYGKEL